MNVSFNLKSPKDKRSAIRVVVTNNGWVVRKSTGIVIDTALWSKAKQKCADNAVTERLRQLRSGIEDNLNDFSTKERTEEVVEAVISGRPVTARKKTPTFWEFFSEFSERDKASQRQRRNQANLIGRLMGREDNWDDINDAYYLRLIRALDKEGYGKNYQGAVITLLKAAMNEGYRMRWHDSRDYQQFSKPREETFATYLTQEELDMLESADLPDGKQRTRDLFIIGVYTAARFSDYSRLTKDNITDGLIGFVQQKTGTSVVIPCSPKITAILDKYDGKAPKMAQQVFNRQIKEVCKLVGIDAYVTLGRKRVHKWEVISSHTARRTGASLLYMSGVPIKSCMMITGHTTEANFMRYIRVTKEENARKLASNPFFQ